MEAANGQALPVQTAPVHRDWAVDVENMTKTFGTFTAVDHISFHVNKGEIFGLLGPNGAGKIDGYPYSAGAAGSYLRQSHRGRHRRGERPGSHP